MVPKRRLTSAHSSLCMNISPKQKQEDGKDDCCKDSPFDPLRCVGIPPATIVVIVIIAICLSLPKIDHDHDAWLCEV